MSEISPDWLDAAYGELGVHEIAGDIHEERILAYHETTTLQAKADEVPWCSAFACWCMERDGREHTRSALARSWLNWGKSIRRPREGCVVVMKQADGDPGSDVIWREGVPVRGHVGFFVGWAAGSYMLLLGGNQSDSVSVQAYPARRCLGLRWPLGGE